MNYYPNMVNEKWKIYVENLTDVESRQKRIPVLLGINSYSRPKFTLVYCKYCKKLHIHTLEKGIFKPYCIPDSPYNKTGYYIDLIDVPQKTMHIIRQILDSVNELNNTILELTNRLENSDLR